MSAPPSSSRLYFERLPDEKERVTLNVDLVNADSGETFGRASIPFVVG